MVTLMRSVKTKLLPRAAILSIKLLDEDRGTMCFPPLGTLIGIFTGSKFSRLTEDALVALASVAVDSSILTTFPEHSDEVLREGSPQLMQDPGLEPAGLLTIDCEFEQRRHWFESAPMQAEQSW